MHRKIIIELLKSLKNTYEEIFCEKLAKFWMFEILHLLKIVDILIIFHNFDFVKDKNVRKVSIDSCCYKFVLHSTSHWRW